MSHLIWLAITLWLFAVQLNGQATNDDKQPSLHFGKCFSTNYGPGRCTHRDDCDFYDLKLLDAAPKQDCYSQQRPDLLCCPNESEALPLLVARIDNKTLSPPRTLVPGEIDASSVGAAALVVAPPPPASADELPKYPHCGTSFAFRVYGGDNTGLLEFPWTTLLEYTVNGTSQKFHYCGASFIAQRWLLTAAHCFHEKFLGVGRQLTGARIGEWNKTSNPDCITHLNGNVECAPPHIDAIIDRKIVHPLFELDNLTHDIALLRLAQPIDWRPLMHVEPVCLPPVGGPAADQLVGNAVDVSGWGLTEHDNELSKIKRKATLSVQSQDQCKEALSKRGYVITESQLCAAGGPNVDSCNGDSGGPLTVEAYTPQKDRFVYLAGIVSYGQKRCGEPGLPGVYTRVSSYMDWIQETLRNNSRV